MQRISLLALVGLLALAAGCASLSRGDIKRQSESTGVTLEAVKAGSDTADRAARTQSDSTAAIIKATGEARAEEARAQAELAREQQKLEELRARNAENERRKREIQARIEEAESRETEADAEFARLERQLRAAEKAKARAASKWANCFLDVVIDFDESEGSSIFLNQGARLELAETGKILIVKRPNRGVITRRGSKILVCPDQKLIIARSSLLSNNQKLSVGPDYFGRYRVLDQ